MIADLNPSNAFRMNQQQLQQWLEIPAQKWPPNHYALLGLQPGEGGSDDVEIRVLERMERLRPYQLKHPDLVTEGMNQLAQALNCLTDLEARTKYDQSLGFRAPAKQPPKPKEPEPILPDEIPFVPNFDDDDETSSRRHLKMESVLLERRPPSTVERVFYDPDAPPPRQRVEKIKYDPKSPPPPKEIERVFYDPDAPPPPRQKTKPPRAEDIPEVILLPKQKKKEEPEPLVLEAVPDKPKKEAPRLPEIRIPQEILQFQPTDKPAPHAETPLPKGFETLSPPMMPHDPRAERRLQYRELARLRKVIDTWEGIRAPLAEPDRTLDDPAEVLSLMIQLGRLRPILPLAEEYLDGAGEAGELVVSIARKPVAMTTFFSLLPSQREALAQDCRNAHFQLVEKYKSIRGKLRRGNAKGFCRGSVRPMFVRLGRHADWVFGGLALVALALAVLRSVGN